MQALVAKRFTRSYRFAAPTPCRQSLFLTRFICTHVPELSSHAAAQRIHCRECSELYPFREASDYFAFFGLRPSFRIDKGRVKRAYLMLVDQSHPDKYAAKPTLQARAADWSAYINRAHATLRDDLARAKYLMKLGGIEPSAASIDPALLMQAMEVQEQIAEANDDEKQSLLQDQQEQHKAKFEAFADAIDAPERDAARVAQLYTELMYVQRAITNLEEEFT